MTIAERIDSVSSPSVATPAAAAGRSRTASGGSSTRVRRDGKFFRLGEGKFFVKGVTYGPFRPGVEASGGEASGGEANGGEANGGEASVPLPSPRDVRADFGQMRWLGANTVRVYHTPPAWFLDLAEASGLKVFLDVSWPKNLEFVSNAQVRQSAREAVTAAARGAGNHPAIFAISVVNELPPDVVRFSGYEAVADFIDELVGIVKREAPECLATFADFPPTEYLQPRNVDFHCYNVYLHDETVFRNYLARLQHQAGEKPLLLGEYGVDTYQEHTEAVQAQVLEHQLRAVYDEGLAGAFVFSFTDEWHTHGWDVTDWAFGLTRRERDERGVREQKPAFDAVRRVFADVPQTTTLDLPAVSVVICSYNGASTVGSCLRSMGRIRYRWGYEVVFVDDGSTDDTQRIVAPIVEDAAHLENGSIRNGSIRNGSIRNVVQTNHGLSFARNVGMREAKGEVVVYTDSDCEADEDWLYYMMLNLVRGAHVGVGGPNLIPDEGSWVADCVGLSPGGPTHVMLNDREAEHVPGCNMGFWRHAALEVGGFDPQFRSAGDDVDFIWRLQHAGGSIGFAPSGQVWHYRRNTVKAYLKQQRGYGTAEAMLKFKHPDHFNTLGASHWRGRIYGAEGVGVRVGRDVVFHGVFGTGLFQTLYRRPASVTAAMLMSIEWHLLTLFVGVLGIAFPTLFWVALAMFCVPIVLAGVASWQAPAPRHRSFWTRPLVAYLHWRQPITRGLARYTERLKAKVLRHDLRAFTRPGPLPADPVDSSVLRYWHGGRGREDLLPAIVADAHDAGLRTRIDSGWEPWDVEIYGSRYVKVRLMSATEHHGHGRLTRLRVRFVMSTFCRVLLGASVLLAGLLLLTVWPFARPAVLIPVVWLTVYVLHAYRVGRPVLGLIDRAAERAGFYPVATIPTESVRPSTPTVATTAAAPAVPSAAPLPSHTTPAPLSPGAAA